MDKALDIVCENLRRIRKELGLSQAEVAERMGIRQSHFSRIEARTLDVKIQTLEKAAEALGVEIVTFFQSPRIKDSSLLEKLRRIEELSPKDRESLENIITAMLERGLSSNEPDSLDQRRRELDRLTDRSANRYKDKELEP